MSVGVAITFETGRTVRCLVPIGIILFAANLDISRARRREERPIPPLALRARMRCANLDLARHGELRKHRPGQAHSQVGPFLCQSSSSPDTKAFLSVWRGLRPTILAGPVEARYLYIIDVAEFTSRTRILS